MRVTKDEDIETNGTELPSGNVRFPVTIASLLCEFICFGSPQGRASDIWSLKGDRILVKR